MKQPRENFIEIREEDKYRKYFFIFFVTCFKLVDLCNFQIRVRRNHSPSSEFNTFS